MTDRVKISELDLLSDVAPSDQIIVLDVSDTTESPEGTTKRAAKSELKGLNWQGPWVAGSYVTDDAVEHEGTSYVATTNTTEEPSLVATDWDLVAKKGEDGIGAGAMLASIYDPDTKEADVYDMDNMDEGADTKILTAAERAKLGNISITQPVDLDQMELDIAALANGMVYKGDWNASAGTFPGAGVAQIGWFYYVTVAGTVDGVSFSIGDNIVATVDNASATVYATNWSKHDQTDAVQAVVGLTGSVSKAGLLAALNVEDGADVTDAANVGSVNNAATGKTTPVDADTFPITDTEASNVIKKVSFTNFKAFLKTYFDTLYQAVGGSGGGVFTKNTYDKISGGVLPKPVTVTTGGEIVRSEADVAGLNTFLGLVGEDIDVMPLHYSTSGSGTPVSTTIPAGNDLYMIIIPWTRGSGGSPAMPSAVTYDGNACTLIEAEAGGGNAKMNAYGIAIGDLGTTTVADVVLTGFAGTLKGVGIFVYSNVDQTTPIADSDSTFFNASSGSLATLTRTKSASLFLGAAITASTVSTNVLAGDETILYGGIGQGHSMFTQHIPKDTGVAVTTAGSAHLVVIGLCISPANPIPVDVIYANVVDGFSGLTIGSVYYVQNTMGTLGTTPGTATLKVGVAISATEILIVTS